MTKKHNISSSSFKKNIFAVVAVYDTINNFLIMPAYQILFLSYYNSVSIATFLRSENFHIF